MQFDHELSVQNDSAQRTRRAQTGLLFHRRLREERRWPSPELLKEQIMRDVGQAKRYLHLMRVLCD